LSAEQTKKVFHFHEKPYYLIAYTDTLK